MSSEENTGSDLGSKSLDELEKGMKVLFNDRKTPLEVTSCDEEKAVVEGPNGGEYEIYTDEGTLLVSRKGNRRYSSYCKDLRSVGEWNRSEDKWKHSHTGSEVILKQKDTGFWTVEVKGLEDSVETPLYGYSDKEFAEEDALKFISKHPEG